MHVGNYGTLWLEEMEGLEDTELRGTQGMTRKPLSANVRSLTFNKKTWGLFENIQPGEKKWDQISLTKIIA